jgi:hypothetical protein
VGDSPAVANRNDRDESSETGNLRVPLGAGVYRE